MASTDRRGVRPGEGQVKPAMLCRSNRGVRGGERAQRLLSLLAGGGHLANIEAPEACNRLALDLPEAVDSGS